MKKKIYVCPKCGKALNFSDNPEYTFQCFDCDEDFYAFEAKEIEQPRMEGIVDYTELTEAAMKVKEITDTAIKESSRQIEIKGKDILEQIAEYINETLRPIFDSGIYKERQFKDSACIYHGRLQLTFPFGRAEDEYAAVLLIRDGSYEYGCDCIHFNANHEYKIEKLGENRLCFIVENWLKLKESMHRMLPYAIERCNDKNEKALAKQKEMSDIINNFRL